jgi:vacuolar-type H+-ATPase subunit E/Vma4
VDKAGIRDVIQGMLEVEKQAQQVVSAAETEAQELLIRARDEGDRRVEQARHRATEQSHAALQAAIEEAQRRRAAEISSQMAQDAPIVQAAHANLPKALDIVVRAVAPN